MPHPDYATSKEKHLAAGWTPDSQHFVKPIQPQSPIKVELVDGMVTIVDGKIVSVSGALHLTPFHPGQAPMVAEFTGGNDIPINFGDGTGTPYSANSGRANYQMPIKPHVESTSTEAEVEKIDHAGGSLSPGSRSPKHTVVEVRDARSQSEAATDDGNSRAQPIEPVQQEPGSAQHVTSTIA